MNHVPLVTVVRGDPAAVVAQVECETGRVWKVQVFVRITDAGKPTPIDMERQGDGTYQAIIPIALIRGINRFWYYLDARGKTTPDQTEEGVAQTHWNPVTIVDGATDGGGAGGEAGGGGKKALYWLLGGAGVAGGAVLLENHNDNGGGGSGKSPPASPPPPTSNRNDDDAEDEDEEDEVKNNEEGTGKEDDFIQPPSPPYVPVCVLTGLEGSYVSEGTACDTNELINVYVCRTCPNTLVEVTTSWGASGLVGGWNDNSCEMIAVSLPQPPGVPSITVGQYSITIRLNGQIYTTVPWPGASYFDCF